MKKTFKLFISVLLIVIMSACSAETPDAVLDNSDKTKFVDFYTEGEYIYIECELNILSDGDTTVEISAIDDDDVKTGLLKDRKLTGYADANCTRPKFNLKNGENTVSVYFRGDYAGIPEIAAREVPRFIKIESKN